MTDQPPPSRPSSSSRTGRGRSRGTLGVPVLPRGETVASFESYPDAQAAVDRLAHAEFPLKEVSIVGSDLKSVEQVTGKLSYGRAALAGALSGLWIGIFFGLLFVLISPADTTPIFLGAAALIGAGFGLLFNIVVYSLNRRRRDYTSVMQVVASSYAVIVTPEFANRARTLLDAPE